MGARLFVLFFVFMAAQRAGAIKCYLCASFQIAGVSYPNDGNADCANFPPSTYKANVTCDTLIGPSTLCATIAGTLKGPVPIDDGTLRACAPGTLTEPQCFMGEDATKVIKQHFALPQGSTFDGSVCLCKGDYCNGVSAVRPLAAVIALVLATKQFLV
ncbi:uncharacterized protein LOC110980573 [Acanthaster planci]|uniref:Uncharacterized protein LOC110980573 n=1 Tax=Acanthaster planci TaxID=133434 RepID=A0A8B7YKX8_ACAPL|nr:uncharacterized protein LOC110980573 [Acanthaster planci]